MGKHRLNDNPYGVFSNVHEKSMEENLFDLLSLYEILLAQAVPLVTEKQEEFQASHKLLNNQRQAYKEIAK